MPTAICKRERKVSRSHKQVSRPLGGVLYQYSRFLNKRRVDCRKFFRFSGKHSAMGNVCLSGRMFMLSVGDALQLSFLGKDPSQRHVLRSYCQSLTLHRNQAKSNRVVFLNNVSQFGP